MSCHPTLYDVVIPVFGAAQMTIRCFASILNSDPHTRIIWVDNGSPEHDRKEIAAYLAAHSARCRAIWFPENYGFIRATNAGIRESDAPYVVLQNNDTLAFRGLYERLRAALGASPKTQAAGPVSSSGWQDLANVAAKVPEAAPLRARLSGRRSLLRASHPDRALALSRMFNGKTAVAQHMLAFFCTMFPAPLFEKIGLLDEDFGVGFGDDDEFCARIRATGGELRLALGAYCAHEHRTTFRTLYSEDQIRSMQATALERFRQKCP